MVKRGDVLEHPVTGEKITFLQTSKETNGEYALLDLRVKPHGFVAAPHVHPRLQETFEIRKGTFTFVIDGEKREIGSGEGATVAAGAPRLVELGRGRGRGGTQIQACAKGRGVL
jgi:mannose-6-phosphate isomerase-like protein (cupin superfamily)